MTKNFALSRLHNALDEIPKLRNKAFSDQEFIRWRKITSNDLDNIFGIGSSFSNNFNQIQFRVRGMSRQSSAQHQLALAIKRSLNEAQSELESCISQIELYGHPNLTEETENDKSIPPASSQVSKKVFIVHGHNETLKSQVALTLTRAGLEPIILHEQANSGRTIIEKFIHHSEEIAFAVVLLTGDDTGGVRGSDGGAYKNRARQNVILELGFFFGKLGRSHVAAVYEKGVELPSDIAGIVYIEYDSNGAWRFSLGREMKAVGIEFDLNTIV